MNIFAHRVGDLIFAHNCNDSMKISDEYTDHSHPLYEMFYFIDGDIEYIVENRRYELQPHDLLIIRPGEHHRFRIRSDRRYERMTVFYTDQCIPDSIAPLLRDKGNLYSIGDTALEEVFRRMDTCAAEYSGEALSILLACCFNELMVKFAYLDRNATPEQRIGSGISAIVDYIANNLGSPLSIDDICRQFGVSRSYLFKAFTESFHEPPKQYIIRKKIMLAQQLISTGERPISASERCGFSDYSTFYRAYLRIIGTPPSGQTRGAKQVSDLPGK